ncbi:hypothetical protein KIN20_025266 [Parelaphostrongylus tenuis]|uniref:FPL domain-containing protein n=1 Tax=Parelaphostrongylus tenuis TaxID=148309 RepID=A0AAD5QX71_PARTN|nr:hypothetical protein KIN20_025266 [Parelaphostrongylus tenuis]
MKPLCTFFLAIIMRRDEFPLLTESLKFFDSTESMVRIAVRNIVLNIVRVDDVSMTRFVRNANKGSLVMLLWELLDNKHCRRNTGSKSIYLLELVDNLGSTSDRSLNTFIRSAENVIANRERLRDKVDDLVDILHYIGELLDVAIVADPLSDLLSNRFLVPILLNSLAPRFDNHAILLTPVISHRSTVQTFLSAFLFEDVRLLTSQWVRNGDVYSLQHIKRPLRNGERVFYEALLCAFDSSKNDDYLSFYALMLIYAMFQNKGNAGRLLSAARFPYLPHSQKSKPSDSSCSRNEPPISASSVEISDEPATCDKRIIDACCQ